MLTGLSLPLSQTPYFDILVPTIDTQRYGFLMEKFVDIGYSVLFTGTTGVGKVELLVIIENVSQSYL